MNKEEMKEFAPVNAEERIMYGMLLRLDALCNMVDSLIKHVAEKDNVATTSNKVETKQDTQCKAKTKSGNRCKQSVKEGSEYCATHDKG